MAVLTQEIDISKLDSINSTIKNNNSVQGNWINPKTNKKLTFKIVEK